MISFIKLTQTILKLKKGLKSYEWANVNYENGMKKKAGPLVKSTEGISQMTRMLAIVEEVNN